MRFLLLPLLVLPLAVAAAPDPAKPPRLEKALRQQAPRIMDYLKENRCRNVGVLKFQVRKDGKVTDNAGLLNLTIARRLEVALVLADDEKAPIGIIQNASAVAAQTKGANHLSAAGRAKLFEPSYPLAWGKDKVKADTFLTGVVTLLPKRDRMSIQLMVFTNDGKGLKELLPPFEAAVDVKTLEDSGESFNLRGLFDGGEIKQTDTTVVLAKAQEAAAEVKEEKKAHPFKAKDAPVELVILYGGKPQPVDTVGGQARVPEPNENQRVELLIRKKDPADRKVYGVVVKVNGRNTLFREQEVAELCHKWLLTADHTETLIRGFQDTDKQVRAFRVASPGESRENEIRYGDDVGTISMTVFRAETGDIPKDLPGGEKEAGELAALTRGALPTKKEANLRDLKDSLADLGDDTIRRRGILEEGEATPGNVERMSFTPNPTPVLTVTISYYQRRN